MLPEVDNIRIIIVDESDDSVIVDTTLAPEI